MEKPLRILFAASKFENVNDMEAPIWKAAGQQYFQMSTDCDLACDKEKENIIRHELAKLKYSNIKYEFLHVIQEPNLLPISNDMAIYLPRKSNLFKTKCNES